MWLTSSLSTLLPTGEKVRAESFIDGTVDDLLIPFNSSTVRGGRLGNCWI
jgi:hypothetical protein